ncbi:hypothetical protein GcM3_070009 [Golovinomyces cichoracearum]|uniref:Uncharacterized protein n=1 Tax=Golovinomyces cichoracearum TaxID=62708 RepID=A0A420ISQ2_9PEZI|nr:hypothetical protein GcM3_070009 [Golovinomyces cichoracearum]
MDHLPDFFLPSPALHPEINENTADRWPLRLESLPSIDLYQENTDKSIYKEGLIQAYRPCMIETSEMAPKSTLENENQTQKISAIDKGKGRAYKINKSNAEELFALDSEYNSTTLSLDQISRISQGSSPMSFALQSETHRATFCERHARAKNGGEAGGKNQKACIETWTVDQPTSARSFGVLILKSGIWRDFAYRWPWPEPPGTSYLMNPEGFGRFFSGSLETIPKTPINLKKSATVMNESIPQQIHGEFKHGDEYFSDPRTANKVDKWLLNHSKRSVLRPKFKDHQNNSLLKQIFDDPKEVELLRDLFALIDFNRILTKSGIRIQSTKDFIKLYRKNAEVILSKFRRRIKYRENIFPSIDQLSDFKRWRAVCSQWRVSYNIRDISYLQSLQKDANNLARSYFNIRAQEDSDIDFVPIYRAFYQLELYCELFRMSKFSTSETSSDKIEMTKRMFFERYQPYEAELVLKISRWLVREWNTIDRLSDGHVKDTVRAKMRDNKTYEAFHRNLGINFFSELLYSVLHAQAALIYKNKWQLNLIRFSRYTNCWAAQNVDENGNILHIEDQELIEGKSIDEKRRKFGSPFGSSFESWTRIEM